MPKIAYGLIAAAILIVGGISTPASALTTMPANGLATAWDATATVQDVHWRGRGWGHRHHWGHRWHHRHWRRW
jgi:hypothetical protein